MKSLRYTFAVVLVCAFSGMAKADPVDFHMVVVDSNPTFNTTSIVAPPVDVTFAACVTGQVGGGANNTYDGCASFINSTGATLTSLELVFPDTPSLNSQAANCTPDGGTGDVGVNGSSIDFFQQASCSIVDGNYVLDYTDGSIGANQFFTIAEAGVDPSDFPTGTLTTTPEPSSIWLLSTGALLLCGFFYYKRRNGFDNIGL